MKILFISSGILPVPPVSGGAVENLIDMILKDNEEKKKYDLTVYSIINNIAKEESSSYKNCEFKYIDTYKKQFNIKRVVRGIINRIPKLYIGNAYISEIIKNENFNKYDMVIVENVPEFAIPLHKKVKKNLILHLHNDRLNKNTKKAKKICEYYNKIFVLSNYIGDRVKEISDDKKEKVKILYNGVDVRRFGKEKYKNEIQKLKNEYRIEANDKVILYSGRIVPEKGVKELVQAFVNLDEKHIKLVIAGSVGYGCTETSMYIEEIKNIAQKSNDIIFTGYVDYETMPKLYAIADMGVVPSIWEEPFALTVIEHMATGNPVVISNSGGMSELVNDKCSIVVEKENNYVINLTNAIRSLINDKNKTINMGIEAKKQGEKFDKSIYIKNFQSLLEEGNENG